MLWSLINIHASKAHSAFLFTFQSKVYENTRPTCLLIITAYLWCLTSFAVSDKCIPEWLSISSTGLRSGLLGCRMSGVKSGVLCHSSSVLLCTRGALESKCHQQLDRCMAATVWAAIHHSNSPMYYSLSPLAAWKPHKCTSAWRHRLKPTRRNMFIVFIRNQCGRKQNYLGFVLHNSRQQRLAILLQFCCKFTCAKSVYQKIIKIHCVFTKWLQK